MSCMRTAEESICEKESIDKKSSESRRLSGKWF